MKEKSLTEFYGQKKYSKKRGEYIYYPPECIECVKEKSTQWRLDNPERYKEHRHNYGVSEKGREKYREYARKYREDGRYLQWQRDNKDKVHKYAENWRVNKSHQISDEELQLLYDYAESSCMYCGMLEEIHKEIYGQRLHRDHAINSGSDGIENCILACRCCNSSKSDKDWESWYLTSRVYSENNYIIIKDWLDFWK